MGFRFRKSIKILPGIRLNVSKSGMSWTLGPRGSSVGIGKQGVFQNMGIPGTGLSFRERIGGGSASSGGDALDGLGDYPRTPLPRGLAVLAVVLGLAGLLKLSGGSYVWAVLLLLGAVGALILRGKFIQVDREMAAERAAELEAKQAEARRARWDTLMARHGQDRALVARIVAGELWIGQTAEQLRDAYGEPEDIDEKVMKTRRREIWKYDEVGTNRYQTKITLDDGIVAQWDKRD